jgi:hypothetical protein
MKRFHRRAVALGIALSLPIGIAAARSDPGPPSRAGAKPIRLADATLIVEVNATDGDAGLQVFLDGEPWRSMTISSPDGRRIVALDAKGRLRNYGLTELFSESSEPPFNRFPLSQFKRLFPAGTYRFEGRTIDGRKLVGRARLSHDIPDGPEITSPVAGAAVPRGAVVARWNPVAEHGGVEITGYRAILEREHPLRVFNADLPALAHSVTVPAEFLEARTGYKLEVQAIEASGNQTLTEITFRVG